MGLHSNISPSAAKRWMSCPGSVALCAKLPPSPTSVYAAEGTAAHGLGEKMLRGQLTKAALLNMEGEIIKVDDFEIEVTDEMIESVLVYYDAVQEVIAELKSNGKAASVNLEVEKKVVAKSIDEHVYGTADATVYQKGNILVVPDLKYGKGVPVEVVNNPQGLIYAIGAMDNFAGWVFDKIRIGIIQPRAPHSEGPVRWWEISVADARAFVAEAKAAVALTRTANAPLAVGDWCKFCPAKSECTAMYSKSQEVAGVDFSCVAPEPKDEIANAVLLSPVKALSVEAKAKMLAWEDTVMQMFAAIKEDLTNELNAGREVPGFKLVEGRSNRKYTSEADVEAEFGALLGERIYEKKLLSPAKLEKVVGKGKLDHLTYKPPANKTIARASDPRSATITSAQADFGGLTKNSGGLLDGLLG